MSRWRRLSDWKASVFLVHLDEVPAELFARGWQAPPDRLRPRWPALAALVQESRFVRVEGEVLDAVRAAGVPVVEVGYHRGTDGLWLVSGDLREEIGAAEVCAEVAVDAGADAPPSDELSDVVDALLRVWTESSLTERQVLLAALAPPLGPPGPLNEAELDAHEPLGPPPAADDALLERVARALPRQAPPSIRPEERRRHLNRAGAFGLLALAGLAFLAPTWPIVAVALGPVVVVCAIVVGVHWAALAQGR